MQQKMEIFTIDIFLQIPFNKIVVLSHKSSCRFWGKIKIYRKWNRRRAFLVKLIWKFDNQKRLNMLIDLVNYKLKIKQIKKVHCPLKIFWTGYLPNLVAFTLSKQEKIVNCKRKHINSCHFQCFLIFLHRKCFRFKKMEWKIY